MILYHGTNMDFEAIDITRSNPYKDFGKGFYLTDIRKQAEELAKKRSRIFGGKAQVLTYEFGENNFINSTLNILTFEHPTKEWADFIYQNRNRNISFKHNYDIVIGPIADDGVAYLLSRYEEGSFTLEQLAKELKYKKLNKQFYFGTQRAIDLLKRIL